MRRHEIKDVDWDRIKDFLPGQKGGHGGVAKDNRLFINALFYLAKTGIPWRDLPERFGKWNSIWQRFNRWCRNGVWQRILQEVQDPDLEWLLIDSTVIRAHPHAAGHNTPDSPEALGYSRGGFGTKIHVAFDALGNPVTIALSPGQDADIKHADEVLGESQPEAVLADKGYDSDELVETIEASGVLANIPPRSNRKNKRPVDWHRYRARHLVECFFNRLKQFRRIATRYDKLASRFNAFLHLACAYVWLL